MPPLEQSTSSLSTSLHSVGGHVRAIPQRPTKVGVTSTTRTSSSGNSKMVATTINNNGKEIHPTIVMMNELRTARDGCIGAIMALLHFLSQHGVAASSITEETKQLKSLASEQESTTTPTLSGTNNSVFQYESMVRKILKFYLVCISKQIREIVEVNTIHMLILGCWQTQLRYAKIQHLLAYQQYHTIRFGTNVTNHNHLISSIATTTNSSSDRHGSSTSSSSTTMMHSQSQYRRPSLSSSLSTTTSAMVSLSSQDRSILLKRALQYQIQMAEYVCTCQKEILLCQRSYERKQEQKAYVVAQAQQQQNRIIQQKATGI